MKKITLVGALLLLILLGIAGLIYWYHFKEPSQRSTNIPEIQTPQLSIAVTNNHPSQQLVVTDENKLMSLLEERKITTEGVFAKGVVHNINLVELVFDEVDHKALSIWSDASVDPPIMVTSGIFEIEGETVKIYLQVNPQALTNPGISAETLHNYLHKQLIDVVVAMSQNQNIESEPEVNNGQEINDINADRLYDKYYQNQSTPMLALETK